MLAHAAMLRKTPAYSSFPVDSSNMTQHFSISIEHSAHTAANPLANTSNTPLQLWRWPVAMVLPNSRPLPQRLVDLRLVRRHNREQLPPPLQPESVVHGEPHTPTDLLRRCGGEVRGHHRIVLRTRRT